MSIGNVFLSKFDVADISVVASQIIEGKRCHRFRIENADERELYSLLIVLRNLRSLHCRSPFVIGGFKRITPCADVFARAAGLLLAHGPEVGVRSELRPGELRVSHFHASWLAVFPRQFGLS